MVGGIRLSRQTESETTDANSANAALYYRHSHSIINEPTKRLI
jgi:hypothetical protein